jgi:hypothetical protein
LTLLPVRTAKKAYSTAYNVADYSQNIAKKSVKTVVTTLPYGNFVYGKMSNLKHAIFDKKQSKTAYSNDINVDEFGSREFLYDTKSLAAKTAYLAEDSVPSPIIKSNIKKELFEISPNEIEEIKKNAIKNDGYLNGLKSLITSPFLGFMTPKSNSVEKIDDNDDDPFAYRKRLYQ